MRHFERTIVISASPDNVFKFADNHSKFSSHMNKSSWMMGGGKMVTTFDEGKGQKVASHIKMAGKVFGFSLALDEVISKHEPPRLKVWHTVGKQKLLVVGSYEMGFEISSCHEGSNFRVYIDYDMSTPLPFRLLGYIFGGIYAKWCVEQMTAGVAEHFGSKQSNK